MPGDFSHQTPQRYAFFLTMQRSTKNIISSKVNIFFLSCIKLRVIVKKSSIQAQENRQAY